MSIKMTKLCCKFIAYLFKLIFEASLLGGEFPECWKRANVLPVHKKERNLVKNYRPISLLAIFGKFFERVIFKDLFNYLHKNELFTKSESGFYLVTIVLSDFLPGDYFLLFMTSTLHLPVIWHRMSGAYFWIFPKRLIKYGTRGYCIN